MAKKKTLQEQKEELMKQMQELQQAEEQEKAREIEERKIQEVKEQEARLIPLPPKKDNVEVNMGLSKTLKLILILSIANTFLFLLWIALLFVI